MGVGKKVRSEQRQELHFWARSPSGGLSFLKIMKSSPYNIVIDTLHFHFDSFTNWKEILPSAVTHTHTFYIHIYYEFWSVTSIALEVFTSNICID